MNRNVSRPGAANMGPKVTLVHDWLTGLRGGEKCLEPACRRWPDAKLLTLIHTPGSVPPSIEKLKPQTSFLNRLPAVSHYYRYTLPLMPAAISRLRVPESDVVLSFSHAVAKGVVVPAGVPHVCYCFTPMRYAWHQREAYFRRGLLARAKSRIADVILSRLREWDQQTSAGVTHYIAISKTVQRRIRECYHRDSTVIAPPVDTAFYTPKPQTPREDFYLVVSALAPYKRFDLAIEACNKLRKKLIIIGSGQDEAKLKRLAGPTVTFLGRQPDEVLRDHYRRCRALLFPAEEDFGIVPLEAQASGAAVIAYDQGGAAETIRPWGIPEPTGLFFDEQTTPAVIAAIESFEKLKDGFDPAAARRVALAYRKERYEAELFSYMDRVLGLRSTVAA